MRVVACGIGNIERGDDAFGPFIIDGLHEGDTLRKIDCGIHPENYLNVIVSHSPDIVLFFDTIRQGEKESVLLRNDEIARKAPPSVSGHCLSLAAMYEFLRENGVKDILFLGVPVQSYSQISPGVRAVADRLISALNNVDNMHGLDIIKMYEVLSEQLR
ncbi:MAG: hydrogenase maturation protease [candidate division WOR-3 bacterium]|nr:MAG: hydrogenase maturation protease [candidate division WOR-3 bacterium]